eukprot:Phypoly_transcript_04219.p1 GENE.Phypoly_transcript_04219~~Phypoly_transcript_04219.p1  ORF type:complete len:501 (+),score=131.57 Phypoly_transcript_04219:498-2000(+)
MLATIDKYAEMRDPLALTRMKKLLSYNVLTQEQVFEIFETATRLNADVSVYNIPLRLASEARNLSFARDIVDYMENTPRVSPSLTSYCYLITAHTGSPEYKEAGKVLEKLRSYDAAQPEHYTALIELYGGEGEMALCVETYSEFIKGKHKPDVGVMSAMVEAFVKNNQIEHALTVVAKMRGEQMKIPVRVFNAVLTLCKHSSKKTAMVLQFMKAVNTGPNSDTIAIVNDDVDYKTILNMWAQVTKTQFPIPMETMQLMLARCSKEIDLVRIHELTRDVLKLAYGLRATTPIINSVLKALVDAKEVPEKVWHMYQTFIAIIDEPDKETFEVLISYFAICDPSRAFRLYESMQKQQLPLTDRVCDALLLAVPHTSRPTNAIVAQLVRKAAEMGFAPSREALEHIITMVPFDHMEYLKQLTQRRKEIEDAEEQKRIIEKGGAGEGKRKGKGKGTGGEGKREGEGKRGAGKRKGKGKGKSKGGEGKEEARRADAQRGGREKEPR